MPSGRGVLIFAAGIGLWLAARFVGSPTLHIVAVGLVALPVAAALFARWGRQRLTITRRQLQELHRGENPKGLFLPAYRLGRKTIRYRLADVLRVEWQAMQGGSHG